MSFGQALALGVGLLFLLLLLVFLRRLLGGPGPLPYFSREFLLSKGENAFFQVLLRALPGQYLVCMKVRLVDVINCPGEAWKAGYGARISQKHVDFVIVDSATTAIALVIELDDRTHQRADRRARDQFVDSALAAAKVPILHVPAAAAYDPRTLRAQIMLKLNDAVPTARAG